MTSPTTPRDAIAGLSERRTDLIRALEDCARFFASDQGYNYADFCTKARDLLETDATQLDALSARVKELEGLLNEWEDHTVPYLLDRAEQAEARALRGEQERDEARAALKPFAEFDHATTSDKPDTCVIVRGRVPSTLTLAHFDAARDLVRRLASGPDKEK